MTSSSVHKIVIIDVINSTRCVDTSDGQKVYQLLASYIEKDENVILSFEGITDVITAFLNAAIGQLYNEFSEEKIKNLIKLEGVGRSHIGIVKRTVDRAKKYFRQRASIDDIVKQELGDE